MGTSKIMAQDKSKPLLWLERGPDGKVLPENLAGKKFGRLTAVEYIGKSRWVCECDCGKRTIATTTWLKESKMVSCGCYKNEMARQRCYKHGGYSHKLYTVWDSMKQRCFNPNNRAYHRYGGRGITVCAEWANEYAVFEKWALEAGYKEGLTLERIDNDEGYFPGNCRFATRKEQSRNMRRNRKVARITQDGEIIAEYKTIVEAAEATGCNQVCIGRVCMGKECSTHGMLWKYVD